MSDRDYLGRATGEGDSPEQEQAIADNRQVSEEGTEQEQSEGTEQEQESGKDS
jgi:hypothetical protein